MTFPKGSYCEARVQNEGDTAATYTLNRTEGKNWVGVHGHLEPGEPALVVHGQLAGTREIYYVLTASGLVWMSAEHLSRTVSTTVNGRQVIL